MVGWGCQGQEVAYPKMFFLMHRFHSISVTRAQGIPKYKIGFGREKDGRVGERLVEGGGESLFLSATGDPPLLVLFPGPRMPLYITS